LEQLVESGQYQDASEAIHDALCTRQHRLRLNGAPLKGAMATQHQFTNLLLLFCKSLLEQPQPFAHFQQHATQDFADPFVISS
jgi:hypothetical protein